MTWRLERIQQTAQARGLAPCVAIQQEWSYLHPRPGANLGVGVHADDELLDYLRENRDVSLIAYSPFLKGIYRDQAARDRYYAWAQFESEYNRAKWERIQTVSRRLGVGGNQLVLAWMLHQELPVFPLIGPRTLDQLRECLAAAEIRLDAGTLQELNCD
jgi:aryl-alcohol dehydrogenase-like predicted oxidoreductase